MDVINETSKTYLPNGDLPDAEIKDPNSQWQPAMHLL